MTLTLPEGRLVALCMSDRLVVVWTYAHDPLRGVWPQVMRLFYALMNHHSSVTVMKAVEVLNLLEVTWNIK